MTAPAPHPGMPEDLSARFNRLVESLKEEYFFYSHDTDGVFTYISPSIENILGWTREEFLRHYTSYLTDNPVNEKVVEYTNKSIKGISVPPYLVEIFSKDGSVCHLEVTEVPVFHSDGRVIAVEGIAKDITLRRRTEQHLQETQKMEVFGRLAAGIAHDFNNIMGIILVQADHALGLLQDPESIKQRLERIVDSAKRGGELTRQILGFARQGSFRREALSMNQSLRETLNIFRQSARQDIRLSFDLLADPDLVFGDPALMTSIFLNLFMNANDALESGGLLSAQTKTIDLSEDQALEIDLMMAPGKYILTRIEDNGCGMSEKVLAHVFEPFFTTKEVGKGTGLGLSNVYGAVKEQQGFIQIASQTGKGTSVTLYFPLCKNKQAMTTTEAQHPIEYRQGLALIADDEADMLEILKLFLEELGFQTLTAGNGREALEAFEAKSNDISIAILDMRMPIMNGTETAARIRKIRPDLPILLSTGYEKKSDIEETLHLGSIAYLQKPYFLKDLAKCIDGLLRK